MIAKKEHYVTGIFNPAKDFDIRYYNFNNKELVFDANHLINLLEPGAIPKKDVADIEEKLIELIVDNGINGYLDTDGVREKIHKFTIYETFEDVFVVNAQIFIYILSGFTGPMSDQVKNISKETKKICTRCCIAMEAFHKRITPMILN